MLDGDVKQLVERWLEEARPDVDLAEDALAREYAEEASFHVQQAVEKTLKAALIAKGIEPPKTHDLPRLINLLGDDAGVDIEHAGRMTSWAVNGRYAEEDDVLVQLVDVGFALRLARRLHGDTSKALFG